MPPLVMTALDQFHDHYRRTFERERDEDAERQLTLERPDAARVHRRLQQHDRLEGGLQVHRGLRGGERGDRRDDATVPGEFDLFSNFDPETGRPRKKPPTLLIDSDALENSDQVDKSFRDVFASEIEDFKREYARLYGRGAAEALTDAEILREVVNTVGEPGKLGAHVRCVVSVSMLTEGWDANTVTHIMGLRAFNSQLLCEQVAGRALRRRNYLLQKYDKDGYPEPAGASSERFPPEYAHIIGVPFKLFKGGTTETPAAGRHHARRRAPRPGRPRDPVPPAPRLPDRDDGRHASRPTSPRSSRSRSTPRSTRSRPSSRRRSRARPGR